MSDYVSRQLSAGDTYHIAESSGFVAGSQDNVVQNNSFGFDPSELKQFADLVMQFAPALGIPAEQQANLIHDAENLADEAASGDLAPGKIRAAYERVQTALEAITTTTAGLTLLAEKGHEAYRAVFGG